MVFGGILGTLSLKKMLLSQSLCFKGRKSWVGWDSNFLLFLLSPRSRRSPSDCTIRLRPELTGVFVNVVEGDCGREIQNNLSGVLLCRHVK